MNINNFLFQGSAGYIGPDDFRIGGVSGNSQEVVQSWVGGPDRAGVGPNWLLWTLLALALLAFNGALLYRWLTPQWSDLMGILPWLLGTLLLSALIFGSLYWLYGTIGGQRNRVSVLLAHHLDSHTLIMPVSELVKDIVSVQHFRITPFPESHVDQMAHKKGWVLLVIEQVPPRETASIVKAFHKLSALNRQSQTQKG